VLVIGGGLAGLCAALRARECGAGVIITAKGNVGRSGNTIMARNSMAAVMERLHSDEPVKAHIEDTMDGGAQLNDRELATLLAGEAGAAIRWLAERGVPFLRDNAGLVVKGSPGHSENRIISVDWSALGQSRTIGMAMTLPLLDQVKGSGVQIVDNLLITGLVVNQGRVTGAYGFHRGRPRLMVIGCRAVVLACGGAGRLYPVNTNTGDVTGDSYALAHLAGATLRDMEFIQFHPLMTLEPPRMVLSTAPFIDGAVLRNREGEEFMPRYSSQGCLATRDVMARAIMAELEMGRGTDRDGVYMDFSSVSADMMIHRYADILAYLKGGFMLEVAPAAHFTMGGVVIDGECRTTVPGLFGCGEAAGGVHGANRLAGNALTEAAVFGLQAGIQAAGEMLTAAEPALDETQVNRIAYEALTKPYLHGVGGAGSATVSVWEVNAKAGLMPKIDVAAEAVDAGGAMETEALVRELRELMGRHVGLVRSRAGLQEIRSQLVELKRRLDAVVINNYRDLLGYHRASLMLTTAGLIADAALVRKESLGAHFRLD